MNIGGAVAAMRSGKRVARKGWNGRGMWVYLVGAEYGDALGPIGGPPLRQAYVEMDTGKGAIVPWLCSQTDLLADDWEIV